VSRIFGKDLKRMIERNFAFVFRGSREHKEKFENFLDEIGATLIFVKETTLNRKLVVKNLPSMEDEKFVESATS